MSFSLECPEIIIVIPAHDEISKDIGNSVQSIIDNSQASEYEIFILLNYSTSDSSELKLRTSRCKSDLESRFQQNHIFIKLVELESKRSGVGHARKILMDAALLRFESAGKEGIIVNLDADTTVGSNYTSCISRHFRAYPACEAASIPFYHPLEDSETNQAIVNYELHLRYYINMQRWLKLPFAYQTIGSAMAVRSKAYAKEGGMNKRQAGEDFYFLQKYAKNNTLMDLPDTCVYPSARRSERVPFGTGKAIGDFLDDRLEYTSSYNPRSFKLLKGFLDYISNFLESDDDSPEWETEPAFKDFLSQNQWVNKLIEIKCNTKTIENRRNRFYQWFDAFRLMKYLHHMRDNGYEDLDILTCLAELTNLIAIEKHMTLKGYLEALRNYDRKIDYWHQCKADRISKASKTSAS